MRTYSLGVVVVLALALVVGACANPASPSEDGVPPPPPSMPPQALAPPGTNVPTVTWLELQPASPRVGEYIKASAWIYIPAGQGGMQDFEHLITCGGQVIERFAGRANAEVGYSGGSTSFWAYNPGQCVYKSTLAGSTKSRDFVILP